MEKMQKRKQSLTPSESGGEEVELFINGVNYIIFSTTPLSILMVSLGFTYKEDCPLDDRIPRYLIFGGLAGLMTVLLRLILVLTWKLKKLKDVTKHPGLSMVRTVMYLCLLFLFAWNINSSLEVLPLRPNYTNRSSPAFCHQVVFDFSYYWFISFDVLVGIGIVFWISSLLAGFCHPDFLIMAGVMPPTFFMKFDSNSIKGFDSPFQILKRKCQSKIASRRGEPSGAKRLSARRWSSPIETFQPTFPTLVKSQNDMSTQTDLPSNNDMNKVNTGMSIEKLGRKKIFTLTPVEESSLTKSEV